MKVLYGEGVANHSGPESCGDASEGITEALTGETCRLGIEPRNQESGMPTPLTEAEGNTGQGDNRKPSPIPRGPRPQHACTRLVREPGDLRVGRWRDQRSASGRR